MLFSEEPIPANADPSEWEYLAKATSIPLAAGENLYGVEEFLRMADSGVRFLQPDVAKWGGVSGAMNLSKVLPDGISLWPHFMGTAVGQSAALGISGVINTESICEMDVNDNLLRTDLCGDIHAIKNGRVKLPDKPGLVTPPLNDRLMNYLES